MLALPRCTLEDAVDSRAPKSAVTDYFSWFMVQRELIATDGNR